jgi:hypothetical protein
MDVPKAHLEGVSQRIRSDNSASKQLSSALASAGSAAAAQDQALVARGIERWTRQLTAKQRTREEVATRALSVLTESDVPDDAAAPSEDFMLMFEYMVEKVSSDELKDLMARILAGEIRKPGGLSRRTLQIVPILDREIVRGLAEITPYMLQPSWFHVPPSRPEWTKHFSLLSSVAITTAVSVGGFQEQDQAFILIQSKAMRLTWKVGLPTRFFDRANLTPTGEELVSVLPLPTEAKIGEVAAGFKDCSFVEKVEVGDFRFVGNEIEMISPEEI